MNRLVALLFVSAVGLSIPGRDPFGGGIPFRALLDAGLVDAVEVSVVPVLLGDGITPLAPGSSPDSLTLVAHEVLPSGIVRMEYAPEAPPE